MDIIHLLVPSVAAVYERHMETYVNLPEQNPPIDVDDNHYINPTEDDEDMQD